MKIDNKIFWIAPIVAMGIGFLPMPYGYYTLSRLIVCGCSLYYAYNLHQNEDNTFVWVFGFFAILYSFMAFLHFFGLFGLIHSFVENKILS